VVDSFLVLLEEEEEDVDEEEEEPAEEEEEEAEEVDADFPFEEGNGEGFKASDDPRLRGDVDPNEGD
jgi:hypothetical protein